MRIVWASRSSFMLGLWMATFPGCGGGMTLDMDQVFSGAAAPSPSSVPLALPPVELRLIEYKEVAQGLPGFGAAPTVPYVAPIPHSQLLIDGLRDPSSITSVNLDASPMLNPEYMAVDLIFDVSGMDLTLRPRIEIHGKAAGGVNATCTSTVVTSGTGFEVRVANRTSGFFSTSSVGESTSAVRSFDFTFPTTDLVSESAALPLTGMSETRGIVLRVLANTSSYTGHCTALSIFGIRMVLVP